MGLRRREAYRTLSSPPLLSHHSENHPMIYRWLNRLSEWLWPPTESKEFREQRDRYYKLTGYPR